LKIKTKIILPLLVTAAIGLVVSTLITYRMTTDALEVSSASSKKMAIASAITELEAGIEFNVLNAISLAQTGLLQPYLAGTVDEQIANIEAAQARIVNMRNTYSYAMLGIIGTDGIVLKHTEADIVGKDFSEQAFFKEAMKGKVSTGNPFRYKDSAVYTVASPVYSIIDKKIIGVVFNVSRISDTMNERMHLGDKGYLLVADSDGIVFIHKNQKSLGQDLKSSPWGKEMLQSKSGDIFFEENGMKKVAYYTTLAETNWLAVATADMEELNAPSIHIRNTTAIVSAILLFSIAIIVYFFVNQITSALNRAVAYAKEIAAGNLDNTLKLNTKDELGQLAISLRRIPVVFQDIISGYKEIAKRIEVGELSVKGDPSKFTGDFAKLVETINSVFGRFIMVIDSIPSPVVVLDAELKAKYLNIQAVELTTLDYMDKKCGELFMREDDNTPADGLTLAVRTGKPASGETIAHPCGRSLNIKYNAIPIYNDDNKLVSILQLVTDISAFKNAQTAIMHIAEQAATISEQVASATEELSRQIGQSEQNSVEQATRLAETTSSMEEMNATITEMAVNARESSEASVSAKSEAEVGADVVQKAVSSIELVQAQSIKLKEGMSKLDESAKAISQIMGTISDIADQTNLLALNAAIEAARAGEAGRGFSVVADEVRKLAEKTMLSTVEVGKAVNTIQSNISESVSQVEESVKGIEEATIFASQSGNALNTIVEMVDNAAERSHSIATTSEEQSEASKVINSSLTQVSVIANETAKTMEEASHAVLDLSAQTQALSKLIDDMKRI